MISTNLNREQSSSFGPDVSNIPGDPQLDSRSVKGARRETASETVSKEPRETAGRTLSKTESQNPKHVLKCGKENNCLEGVAGKGNGTKSKATCLRVKGVAANCNERLKSNCRRPGWTTITCKSQVMGTLRKSSRIFVEN